jgi:hypothetical protein
MYQYEKKKYIQKKKPGDNNVCNLPPMDLAPLPHKTPVYKTQKKVILWSDNGDIMAAHIKINADVTGELLLYPAAVRVHGSSVIRITIHYNILNPSPRD